VVCEYIFQVRKRNQDTQPSVTQVGYVKHTNRKEPYTLIHIYVYIHTRTGFLGLNRYLKTTETRTQDSQPPLTKVESVQTDTERSPTCINIHVNTRTGFLEDVAVVCKHVLEEDGDGVAEHDRVRDL